MPDLKNVPDSLNVDDRTVANMIDGMMSDNPRVLPYFGPDDQPGVLPVAPQDLPYFFETLDEVITDYQDRVVNPLKDKVELSEEYPPKQLQTEIITYKVIERSPGKGVVDGLAIDLGGPGGIVV